MGKELTYAELKAQLDAANKKLEEQKNLFGVNGKPMVQLPNGDLWRGHVHVEPNTEIIDFPDEVTPDEADVAIEKALEAIKSQATIKGGLKQSTCNWCGNQTQGVKAVENMRYHLRTQHKGALTQTDEKALLMKSLGDAQAQLAHQAS